jgi:phage terminase Nu1 subunit (DNA packaging protein)
MAILSTTEYAKHRGVSKMTVSRWVREGKVSFIERNGQRFIDTDIADKQVQTQSKDRMPIEEDGPTVKAPPQEGEERKDEALPAASSLTKNRAVKEHFNARLAKLAYEQRSGKLVDKEDVEKEAFVIARRVRDALLSIPDRVSAELAAEQNQFKIHARLTEEIRKSLISLKDLLNGAGELSENQEA